jgi:hypothetical protein
LGDLPRLRIDSIRVVGGRCGIEAAAPPAPVTPSETAAPSREAAAGADTRGRGDATRAADVTVIGCLVRQPDPTAASAARDTNDSLALVQAALDTDSRAVGASAVPGSLPAGSGSGTVAQRSAGTTGTQTSELAFRVVSPPPDLVKLVGQRVRIVGTINSAPQREANTSDQPGRVTTAHRSVPSQQLVVISFTANRGNCRGEGASLPIER